MVLRGVVTVMKPQPPQIIGPQWEQHWLPYWPWATNTFLDGRYMDRDEALTRRMIQANPGAMSNLLVVDIDHSDALLRSMSHRAGWLPNAVVENPRNGHAHAVWVLREYVTRTEYARRKPVAFAAAVTEGLRRSVDGDKGYSGWLTKNPHHPDWVGHWLTDHEYSLPELTAHLQDAGHMPVPGWKRTRRKNPVGLGRNCTIFETARHWAYPRVRDYEERTPAASNALHHAIANHVQELNSAFTEPLPDTEAAAIARSIHKWITTQSRLWLDGHHVNQANFSRIQSARIAKRWGRTTRYDAILEATK